MLDLYFCSVYKSIVYSWGYIDSFSFAWGHSVFLFFGLLLVHKMSKLVTFEGGHMTEPSKSDFFLITIFNHYQTDITIIRNHFLSSTSINTPQYQDNEVYIFQSVPFSLQSVNVSVPLSWSWASYWLPAATVGEALQSSSASQAWSLLCAPPV